MTIGNLPIPLTCTDVLLGTHTADAHGVFKLTKQGHVRLPADARRAGHLSSGDRVLLVAHLDHQTVTVFPPVALDELVLPVLPGGEDL